MTPARVPPSAYEVVAEAAKAHRSAGEIVKAVFDLAAEAAVYEADDVLYTAAGKLDDLAADLESYDDVPDYAAVLCAAHEGVTWVRDTAKVRLEASAQAGGDVPVSGDSGTPHATSRLCACGCGREVASPRPEAKYANPRVPPARVPGRAARPGDEGFTG